MLILILSEQDEIARVVDEFYIKESHTKVLIEECIDNIEILKKTNVINA